MGSTTTDAITAPPRPARFTLWAVAVSVLAAVALITSAAALTVAARDGATTGVSGAAVLEATGIPRWDEAKLEAMEGRMRAETVRIYGRIPRWDEAKLEAMEGRMLAETARSDG
jgi:hypothetical protein